MSDHNNNWKKLASALAVSALLAGCGSDGKDGSDGEDGKPGPVGVHISQADSLNTQNLFAEYDAASNQLVVEFDLVNTNGVSIYGATIDNLTLKMGRMARESEASRDDVQPMVEPEHDREIWASYHHRNGTRGSASMCNSSYTPYNECAVEEIDNGKYRFVVDHALPTSKEEGGAEFFFAYDESQIQGLMMRVQRKLNGDKTDYDGTHYATYYWEAGNVEAYRPKVVVPDETCFACHTAEDVKANQYDSARDEHPTYRMSNAHYGTSTEVCAFCHVDYGLRTVNDGDDVIEYSHSIKGLVHAIHTGATHSDRRGVAKFDSVIAKDGANPAFFLKFNNEEGVYPQSAANCHACHVDYTTTEETLPENVTAHAMDWFADKDGYSCQNCHGDYHYADYHVDDVYYGCVACHTSDEGYGNPTNNRGGALRHFADHGDAISRHSAATVGSNIDVDYTALSWDGTNFTIDFDVTKAGEAVAGSTLSNVTVRINAVAADGSSQFLANRSNATATVDADGKGNVVLPAHESLVALLSDPMNPMGADDYVLAVTAYFSACVANKTADLTDYVDGACSGVVSPYASQTRYLTVAGEASDVRRHAAAAYENCTACHNDDMVVRSSGYHYRNADNDTCAQCHGADGYKPSMMARVHASSSMDRVRAHGRDDVQAFFSMNQCSVCHDNSYTLQDASTGPQFSGSGTYSSPQTAVCASCHLSDAYFEAGQISSAAAHILNMGGIHKGSRDEASVSESCATCHNAENIQKNHKFN
ncbi:hypothetical protein KUV89_18245 [Marinobacter hydrocarbonoclasticus]|nr:hypothetical protein [Marinobacter nauticus]